MSDIIKNAVNARSETDKFTRAAQDTTADEMERSIYASLAVVSALREVATVIDLHANAYAPAIQLTRVS